MSGIYQFESGKMPVKLLRNFRRMKTLFTMYFLSLHNRHEAMQIYNIYTHKYIHTYIRFRFYILNKGILLSSPTSPVSNQSETKQIAAHSPQPDQGFSLHIPIVVAEL